MKKGKSSKKSHTGKIAHQTGLGTKDPLAHESHHKMNKQHGTGVGLSPEGGYEPNAEAEEGGGAGMGDEDMCEHCD